MFLARAGSREGLLDLYNIPFFRIGRPILEIVVAHLWATFTVLVGNNGGGRKQRGEVRKSFAMPLWGYRGKRVSRPADGSEEMGGKQVTTIAEVGRSIVDLAVVRRPHTECIEPTGPLRA